MVSRINAGAGSGPAQWMLIKSSAGAVCRNLKSKSRNALQFNNLRIAAIQGLPVRSNWCGVYSGAVKDHTKVRVADGGNAGLKGEKSVF